MRENHGKWKKWREWNKDQIGYQKYRRCTRHLKTFLVRHAKLQPFSKMCLFQYPMSRQKFNKMINITFQNSGFQINIFAMRAIAATFCLISYLVEAFCSFTFIPSFLGHTKYERPFLPQPSLRSRVQGIGSKGKSEDRSQKNIQLSQPWEISLQISCSKFRLQWG